MWEVLALVVCAVVAGSRTFTAIVEWAADAARYRPVTGSQSVPTLATIHRVCTTIDGEALDAAVTSWVGERIASRAVAIDGKEVRGAKNGTGSPVFLMAALDHDTGTVIGQESIGEKTNEIPPFAALVDQLGDVRGLIVTRTVMTLST